MDMVVSAAILTYTTKSQKLRTSVAIHSQVSQMPYLAMLWQTVKLSQKPKQLK